MSEQPPESTAVSPDDATSDRRQSDADNQAAVDSQTAATAERGQARQQATDYNDAAIQRHVELLEAMRAQTDSNNNLSTAMTEYQERAVLAAERDEDRIARDEAAKVRDRKVLRAVIGGFSAVVLVLILGLGYLVWQQGKAIDGVRDSLNAAQSGRDTIIDCVTPQGQCAQRGAAATAKAVQQISDYNLLISVCATHYTHESIGAAITDTRSCVAKYLTPSR